MFGYGREMKISIYFTVALTFIVLLFVAGSAARGQEPVSTQSTEVAKSGATEDNGIAAGTENTMPVYAEVVGIQLGMSSDEVRDKLGKPRDKGERQDFFVFSDSKTAQIYYDDKGKVVTLSVDYFGKDVKAPSAEVVLGAPVQPKADGSIYQLKHYPEAGCWVAYNRTAGDNPTVTITVSAR
jgi:hypothetical protein